jgi:hypothetical protein
MMGRLARALGGHLDTGLRAKAVELAAAKPDIDWGDPAVRKEHLGELVELAATLLGTAAADNALADDAEVAEVPEVDKAAGLLSRVVLQDVERTTDGPAIRQGVAADRVVSHSDPEMRHPAGFPISCGPGPRTPPCTSPGTSAPARAALRYGCGSTRSNTRTAMRRPRTLGFLSSPRYRPC